MELSSTASKFILHWGEMGSRWGINRTVAQVHALLYVTAKPMNAEEIAATLQVARSNVSNSLRELQSWGIIRTVHRLGDRRDYYESMSDVWEMARIIAAERKSRELDPTIEAVRECVSEVDAVPGNQSPEATRLRAMLEFLDAVSETYEQLERLPTSALRGVTGLSKKLPFLFGSDPRGKEE